jgi:hypothetical protein
MIRHYVIALLNFVVSETVSPRTLTNTDAIPPILRRCRQQSPNDSPGPTLRIRSASGSSRGLGSRSAPTGWVGTTFQTGRSSPPTVHIVSNMDGKMSNMDGKIPCLLAPTHGLTSPLSAPTLHRPTTVRLLHTQPTSPHMCIELPP